MKYMLASMLLALFSSSFIYSAGAPVTVDFSELITLLKK